MACALVTLSQQLLLICPVWEQPFLPQLLLLLSPQQFQDPLQRVLLWLYLLLQLFSLPALPADAYKTLCSGLRTL